MPFNRDLGKEVVDFFQNFPTFKFDILWTITNSFHEALWKDDEYIKRSKIKNYAQESTSYPLLIIILLFTILIIVGVTKCLQMAWCKRRILRRAVKQKKLCCKKSISLIIIFLSSMIIMFSNSISPPPLLTHCLYLRQSVHGNCNCIFHGFLPIDA